MKLNSGQVEQTISQFPAQAIPDDHPVVPQLKQLFGDHSFFLADDGLHVVEPSDSKPNGGQAGKIVKLASWNDASRTGLAPHEPEVTEIEIALEAA